MATDPESEEWADGVKTIRILSIFVLVLVPVGMDTRTVSPRSKRGQ